MSEPGVRRVDVERDGCLRTLHRVQMLGAGRWAQVVVTQVLRPDLASAYGDLGRRQDRRVLLYLSGFTNGLVIDVELDMTAWFGLGREARLYVSGQGHFLPAHARVRFRGDLGDGLTALDPQRSGDGRVVAVLRRTLVRICDLLPPIPTRRLPQVGHA